MKKPMEQLKEIMAVTEEQQGLTGLPEEVKEIKAQTKYLALIVKIFRVIVIICVVISLIALGMSIFDFAKEHTAENSDELYISIHELIKYTAMMFITSLGCGIINCFEKNETPFVPQIPKKMVKISIIMIVAFLISTAVTILYPVFTGMERAAYISFFTDGMNMIFSSILILLSKIFDYGCKLQKESDETI